MLSQRLTEVEVTDHWSTAESSDCVAFGQGEPTSFKDSV
jgi:hypothetical protein